MPDKIILVFDIEKDEKQSKFYTYKESKMAHSLLLCIKGLLIELERVSSLPFPFLLHKAT